MKRYPFVLALLFLLSGAWGAVSSEVSRTDAIGNGATAVYSFTFPVKATSELRVFTEDASGQDDELALGVDYTATLNTSGTGSITLTAGVLSDGLKISIQRGIPYTQTYNPAAAGAYNAASLGVALDRLAHEVIRLKGDVARSIKVPYLEAGGDSVTKLDAPATTRANQALVFDATGNAMVGATVSASASAFAQTLLDDVSAGEALTTLGVSPFAQTVLDDASASVARSTLGVANTYAAVANVKDYGAIGDGVAVDTVAIQAAIDAIAAGTVYFPPGTYVTAALTGKSNVVLRGSGVNASILSFSNSSAGITWTDKSYFGAEDISLGGSSLTHGLRVIASTTYIMRPHFKNVRVSAFASAGIGISFECNSTFPIYFPFIEEADIGGGSAAPSVGTRVGISYAGSGSEVTVGSVIRGGRVTNCLKGVSHTKCNTLRSVGLALDGLTNGASGGIGLEFIGASALANTHADVRFEANPSIDTFVNFGASSADNRVVGSFGGAASARVVDSGTRNSWGGSDGSGGLVDKVAYPITFSSATPVAFTTGVKVGGGSTALAVYEEGTWTPVIRGSSTAGTQTYAIQAGNYTAIGRMVFAQCRVYMSALDGATAGNVQITGLPYVCKNASNTHCVATIFTDTVTLTGGKMAIGGRVEPNVSYVSLTQSASAAGEGFLPVANLANGSGFYVNVMYFR